MTKTLRVSIISLLSLICILSTGWALADEPEQIAGGKEFLEGRRLQGAGEWAASIERFRAAADLYSLVADYALYQISQSALQVGDTDSSASALEELLRLHPDTPVAPRARLELINLYFSVGEQAKAIPYLEAALPAAQSSRESASLTLMLAKAYAAKEEPAKSESVLWRIVHGWPSSREALDAAEMVSAVDTAEKALAVAKVYSLNGKPRKALDLLEDLMIDPSVARLMPEILFYMAQSMAQEGKKQAAEGLYSEIIADYSKSSFAAMAFSGRAKYRRSQGLTDEALSDYARVVERFPRSYLAPEALRERAEIFEGLGSPDEYAEYEKLLENYPQLALTQNAIMHWGVKLYSSGDYAEARRVFEKFAAADLGADADADAAFWIAKCTIAEGNRNLAKIQLAGVIKRFEESHQGFRARSILKTLADVQTIYSQKEASEWEKFFAVERRPFASLESGSAAEAFPQLREELSNHSEQELDRLEFLVLNRLAEAKWELEEVSRDASAPSAGYALAWSMYHAQTYNKSIRAASSLRGRFKEEPRASRLWYLLYPMGYADLVRGAATEYEVDPMLALAVIREESHFDEDVVSAADARGLMQIIPRTGEWLAGMVYGPASFDRTMLFRPSVNIRLGTRYLRYLNDKFDGKVLLVLAAYNWGEGNLRRWLAKSPPGDLDVFIESIPADETRRYVKKVLRSYAIYHSLYPVDYVGRNEKKEDSP